MSEKLIDEKTSKKTETVVDSPDKWLAADEVRARFTITRPDGEQSVILLKGIPAATYYSINKACRAIDPPIKETPQTDKRGKIIPGLEPLREPNYEDPKYIESKEHMDGKRMVLVIDAALPFDIPGDNWKEKHKWLQNRVPGDIDKLYAFIVYDLLNLGQRVGSFL